MEDRQFGPWIRAVQFYYSKKSVVEAQCPNGSPQNAMSQRTATMTGNVASQLMVEGPIVGQ